MNIFSNSSGKSHYCVESPVFLLHLDLPPLFAAIFLWIYFQYVSQPQHPHGQ